MNIKVQPGKNNIGAYINNINLNKLEDSLLKQIKETLQLKEKRSFIKSYLVKDVEKNSTFMVIKTTKVFLSSVFVVFGHWQHYNFL